MSDVWVVFPLTEATKEYMQEHYLSGNYNGEEGYGFTSVPWIDPRFAESEFRIKLISKKEASDEVLRTV